MSDILERRKQAAERQRQQRPIAPGRPSKVQLMQGYLSRFPLGDDPTKEQVLRLNAEAELFADSVLRNSDPAEQARQAQAAEERIARALAEQQAFIESEVKRLLKAAGGDKVGAEALGEMFVKLWPRIKAGIQKSSDAR